MLSFMEVYFVMVVFFDFKGYGFEIYFCGNESLFLVISQLDWNMKYENNFVVWFFLQFLLSYMNEILLLMFKFGFSFIGFIY